MKTKSRQALAPQSAAWWTTNLAGQILNPGTMENPTPYSYVSMWEKIDYGEGRERYNACLHEKVDQECYTPPMRWRKIDSPDSRWDWEQAPGSYLYSPDSIRAWGHSLSNVKIFDWGAFSQRAIEAMTPSMESGCSLGLFLYEIKEIKSLVKWWSKGKTFLRNLTNASLNYSFGLRPFLNDLAHLGAGLYTLRDRLAELKAGAGKLCVRRYSEEESYLQDEYVQNEAYKRYRCHMYIPHITYTATMTYTYQFPDIDESMLLLYAFLDSVGLNLNPQIIWDAVPYTFVVDWFVNVGDFLSQLRKKWIPIAITIKDFGVSAKYSFHGYSEHQYFGKVDTDWVPRQEFYGKYYHRRPLKVEDRCFIPSLTSSGLTARKFYLGALLIEQRLH